MKYARLNPLDGTIAEYIDITQAQYDSLAGNPKQAYLRLFVEVERPVPNATQTVQDGPVVLSATTATQSWLLVAKTAEQLAREADTTADANELAVLRTVYAALKAGTGTAAERLVRLERSMAWVLKKYGAHLVGPS